MEGIATPLVGGREGHLLQELRGVHRRRALEPELSEVLQGLRKEEKKRSPPKYGKPFNSPGYLPSPLPPIVRSRVTLACMRFVQVRPPPARSEDRGPMISRGGHQFAGPVVRDVAADHHEDVVERPESLEPRGEQIGGRRGGLVAIYSSL